MRILVVCQYYYPEKFQINDICEQLVKNGHHVTVLTGLPNYPMGDIPKEYLQGKKRDEIINGVHVLRCFEIGRKPGVLGMAKNYLSYCISASWKALWLKDEFDVVMIYQLSPVLMGIPAIIYRWIHGLPTYLYCCDIWPESARVLLKNDQSIAYKVIAKISNYIYRHVDKISVQSNSFIEYFTKYHKLELDKVVYIPQYSDSAYLNADFKPVDTKCVDFVFLGNIGIAQDVDCILKAVDLIREIDGFKVHFVGDGMFLEEARKIVKDKQLEKIVKFYGRRPYEDMPIFYKMADVCLATLRAGNLISETLPSKIQGYMAAGKPILGALEGSGMQVIKDSGCGICVHSSDALALSNAMKNMINEKDNLVKYGENGRKYFKDNFTKEIFMTNLENVLNDVRRKGQ